MEIKFYNTPEPQEFDASLIKDKPNFIDYRPDFALMEKLAGKYASKKNIVIIGHGGSITSFYGIYHTLRQATTKQVYFISTVDPDYITEIEQLVHPENTLVIAISKSGETVTQIEALLQFINYEMLIVTGVAGPLAEIAHRLNATQVVHPPIGGRFTGFTEVGLLPAALCGFDTRAIYDSGQQLLQQFDEPNIAFESASRFFQLEQQGIADVFMPFYSEKLFPFSNLAVQLCHESFGKDGKGQTYFARQAPESQHHTNQRFFGGQKNIAGWFVSTKNSTNQLVTSVPENLANIPLKSQTLNVLNQIPLQSTMQFEREATIEDAKLQNLPVADMELSDVDPVEIGQFMAFWQLYAVYSALLRNVNPFNQPQVEASKAISFTKRQQFQKKL